MKKNKIKIIPLLLLISLLLALSACGEKKTPPPKLEDIKQELVMRIENSKEVNRIFWGEGLPVVEMGSERAEELGLYSIYNITTVDDLGVWEYVDTEKTEYITVQRIKELAESAYSDSFLKGIYAGQFEGIFDSVNAEVREPHYYEEDFGLWKNAYSDEEFNRIEKTRNFDYETMTMDEDKSCGERVYVTLDSYLEGESEVLSITLCFDLQADGWYLSAPTY